jgi:phytoene synthase
MSNLEKSYAYCEHIARTQARNFYYSFLTLPPDRKAAMCAIYAFFRYSDDVSDEDGDGAVKADRMMRWKAGLDSALAGEYGDSQILPAFHNTVQQYSIPSRYFYELIDGTEMDLITSRYATFQDLHRYCYLVASVVGFVCINVWGFDAVDGKAMEYAEACGLAFQLTNILRDVNEDAQRDRIYLPHEDLKRFSVTEEQILNGEITAQFKSLMQFECERARLYYREAEKLIPLIDPAGRPTYQIMIRIYRGILDSIERNRFDVHSKRARVSTPKKLGIVAQAWLGSRFMPR